MEIILLSGLTAAIILKKKKKQNGFCIAITLVDKMAKIGNFNRSHINYMGELLNLFFYDQKESSSIYIYIFKEPQIKAHPIFIIL